MFAALEAEGAGHSAATGFRLGWRESDRSQGCLFGRHAHGRFLVAMAVQDGWRGKPARERGSEVTRVLLDECTQADGHLVQPAGPWIGREEVHQFVVEDGFARWLQDYDRDAGVQLRLERVHD